MEFAGEEVEGLVGSINESNNNDESNSSSSSSSSSNFGHGNSQTHVDCDGDGDAYAMDDNAMEFCDESSIGVGMTENFIENPISIDGLLDILNIDMKVVDVDIVERFDFADLELAYLFYCWYARVNGFSVRKSHVIRNYNGEKVQQTFVCSREGFRQDRGLTVESRRREEKNETRCGCHARFRVHVDSRTNRWYITVFSFDHNHNMLEEKYCALLPAHRKMAATDIMQIENFKKVGIRASHMYGALANIAGGYEKVGFLKKDLHNQLGRQNRSQTSDASGALKYLRDLRKNDPMMFVTHTVDQDGRLEHMFWCDGESRLNYEVFGDVLAFDATYKKNKYLCPLVVFSGVNHHNQTIVFATALVSNETEHTYVWLLRQLLHVMKGKAPTSVITDGDTAMKNAIARVFPRAHHRLCAWHLLRNAMSNVGNPDVMPYIKKCMLGDYEVIEFERIWGEMVDKFGLHDNNWVRELYDRRNMWATAHIRGTFFAGIRTTSRCEVLHSHIGQFVHSRINLTDFVQQYHRCITYFRYREVEADFHCNYGEVVLQTNLRSLERDASRLYTKDIFYMFRRALKRAALVRVIEEQDMSTYIIYALSKYRGDSCVWHVSFQPSTNELRCSCLRMESIGVPCEHILRVLVYRDFDELPKCLVLHRWTKRAKEAIRDRHIHGSLYWDSHLAAMHVALIHLGTEVANLAHVDIQDYDRVFELLYTERDRLRLKYNMTGVTPDNETQNTVTGSVPDVGNNEPQGSGHNLDDPVCARTKGCGRTTITASGRTKQTQSCGGCGAEGHNRRSCPIVRLSQNMAPQTTVHPLCTDGHGVQSTGRVLDNAMFNQHAETVIASASGVVDTSNFYAP